MEDCAKDVVVSPVSGKDTNATIRPSTDSAFGAPVRDAKAAEAAATAVSANKNPSLANCKSASMKLVTLDSFKPTAVCSAGGADDIEGHSPFQQQLELDISDDPQLQAVEKV